MIDYIIKSGLCLTLVWGIYKILLEREHMYHFNRYYLLFGLGFSLVVPLITFTSFEAVAPINETLEITALHTPEEVIADKVSAGFTTIHWIVGLLFLYGIGVVFSLSRFAINLLKMFQRIRENLNISYKKASLVLLKEHVLPHSFLRYIFLEEKAYKDNTVSEELYIHELAHVNQKHSLDIIFVELIQMLFWFNPLLIFYKKAIQLNHEFLADEAVLKSNKKVAAYQLVLLEKVSSQGHFRLASNFNFSVTKKRLQMMTKHTSRTRAWLLATLTIPVYICALFLFSTKVMAHEATYNIQNVRNSQILSKDINDSKKAYYQNATFIIEDSNGKKVKKTFAELTEAEKSILVPPPRKPNFQKPGKVLLNDLKNKEKFAVWLDGKAIDNEEVSKHTIVHHTKSFVHKNARSKRFPQSYQVQLYTAKGFQAMEQEFGTPLAKGTVIHINLSNKHIRQIHQKNKVTPTKNIQNEIAEINKLSIQYTDRQSDKKAAQSIKDIVVKINKNGRFLVNYKHSCSFDELDKYIKQELRGILHKKARTALIIFDDSQKDVIQKVKKVLADNKISHVSTMDAADIPPPPPPPAKPEVVRKQWKNHNPIDVMNTITKGLEIKTMIIDGEKYSYVIKNGRKYIFDKNSRLVNDKGELLPPPPPPAPIAPKNKN